MQLGCFCGSQQPAACVLDGGLDTWRPNVAVHRRSRQQRRRLPPVALSRGPAAANSSSSVDEPPALSDDESFSVSDEAVTPASGRRNSSGSSSSCRDPGRGGSLQRDTWRVPIPPHLHGKAPRRHWNANALAFLGDSVWEVIETGNLVPLLL